ncbi:MAG: LexA family transcriptional regulator [Bacteroidota bacterium]
MLKRNLRYLRKKRGMSQEVAALKVGIARSALASYETGKSEPKAGVLMKLATFFQVNVHELLYADFDTPLFQKKGTAAKSLRNQDVRILTVTVNDKEKQNIEFVPVAAIAGYAQSFVEPEFVSELTRFSLPKLAEGQYRAFEIQGDSMPPIDQNYVVVGRFVEHYTAIKNGKRYILLTKDDGLVFKRVFNEVNQNQRLILVSDNAEYLPYTVRIDTVLEVWEMCAFIGYDTKDAGLQQAILDKLHHIEHKIGQLKIN